MANCSWIVVCSLLLVGAATLGTQGAAGNPASGEPDADAGNNASSSMYFHQMFSHESSGNVDGDKPASTINHPTSIQAVNHTVNGGNLTSSETQHFYGYEPTGINKRHVHYPPVPMDVINSDDSQNDEGDDYDDDADNDDADYDDGDQQSSPNQGSDDGDGEDRDDDFDHAASFAIPKMIDTNQKGCKTVYKEIQTGGPGKVKAADDDFDADFAFKRRRRKRSAGPAGANSATAASYVMSRECHSYSDDSSGKKRNKLAQTLPPPAADADSTEPNSEVPSPSVSSAQPTSAGLSDSMSRSKVTGESRFMPINADPWRPRMARGIAFGDRLNGGMLPPPPPPPAPSPFDYQRKIASATPFLEADDATIKKTQMMFDQDGQNTRHFHKYPYPHYHIYYNRKGTSVLDENALYNGNNPNNNADTTDEQSPNEESNANEDSNADPATFDSPNTYFEFTHPHGNTNEDGDGGEPNDAGNDEDYDEDGPDGDDGGDNDDGNLSDLDRDINNAPAEPEGRSARNRRGVKGLKNADDASFDFTIAGPNFYKTGTYKASPNGKKPSKYTYNYFKSDDPEKLDDTYQPNQSQRNFEIDHSAPKASRRGDGDYNIHYGAGTEYNKEYDSSRKPMAAYGGHGGGGEQQEGDDGSGGLDDGQQDGQDEAEPDQEEEDDWNSDGFPIA